MFRVLCFVTFYLVYGSGVEYSRNDAGYAMGFSYECVKLESPPVLSPQKLEQLFLSVMGPGKQLTSINYYQAKEIPKNPYMDFSTRTVIYVRGYWELFFQPITRTICQLYRKMGYNVLVLNAAFMKKTVMSYPRAATYVQAIGLHVAEMLATLSKLGLEPKKLDIVGAGMGAHTASFIAKNYRLITGRNISSITALDPAGPCFRHLGPKERLDPSDADFVMDMAVNIDGHGMATPVGHVTFYMNGGEFQPADVWFMPCDLECSHSKTYAYWVSALINPHTFLGIKCDTIQQARDADCYDVKPLVYNSMDLFVDRSKPGIYFVPTFSRYPYSLGKAGLRRENEQVIKHMEALNAAPVMKW